MSNSDLIHFYKGWMIEVIRTELGFYSICYSHQRDRVGNPTVHSLEYEALMAASGLIDRWFACHSLAAFLRESYEDGVLEFEDWQSLSQSLTQRSTTV